MTTLAVVDQQASAAAAAGASESDLNLIAQLKQRAADFELARAELQRLGAAVARTDDYDLLMEYSRLVERSDSIRSKIAAATTAIDNAAQWSRGALGDLSGRDLGALGLVWFLPAAIILAAIAVIGYWITDYQKFASRFNEQTRIATELVAGGMSPAAANVEAGRAVAATAPGILGGAMGGTLTLGLIAVVGLFLFARNR